MGGGGAVGKMIFFNSNNVEWSYNLITKDGTSSSGVEC